MSEFFDAVRNYAFIRNAVAAGALASIACGVVGTYIVTRRITLIAGSLAHTVLGGMGVAYYIRVVHGVEWLHPLHGALAAAVLAAFIISLVRFYGREREDTVISALWAIGMAVGVVFLFYTPGYKADLMTYLFGNIVLADAQALRLLVTVDVIVLAGVFFFYNPLLAVCFDEEFATLRGVNVPFFYTLLLVLTALTIVSLIYVVGIILAIALLTLPVAVADRFSRRLWEMMVLSAALSVVLTTAGIAISYAPDLPAGAVTILLAGAVYLAARLLDRPFRRVIGRRGNASRS